MEHLEMDTDNLTLHTTYTRQCKQQAVNCTSHTSHCTLQFYSAHCRCNVVYISVTIVWTEKQVKI